MQSSNLERYYRDRLLQSLVAMQTIIRRRPTGDTQKAKYAVKRERKKERQKKRSLVTCWYIISARKQIFAKRAELRSGMSMKTNPCSPFFPSPAPFLFAEAWQLRRRPPNTEIYTPFGIVESLFARSSLRYRFASRQTDLASEITAFPTSIHTLTLQRNLCQYALWREICCRFSRTRNTGKSISRQSSSSFSRGKYFFLGEIVAFKEFLIVDKFILSLRFMKELYRKICIESSDKIPKRI